MAPPTRDLVRLATTSILAVLGLGLLALGGYFWHWEMTHADSLGVGLLLAPLCAVGGLVLLLTAALTRWLR